jgi:pimeloyl-ACP methyl ester carboxylesterase
MNDVAELKQYVGVHARAQGIPPAQYEPLLDQVSHDDDGPGSWVAEWSRAAERLERDGRLLEACRYYNMARFPYVDGQPRRDALTRCVTVFDRWRRENSPIQRLDLDLPQGRLGCWTVGLDPAQPRPVLLVMGGIVSVKEQWAPLLLRARALGMAGLVTEMPGVGENAARYDTDSPRMLSHVLDALRDRGVDATQTYAMTLSFSGHMALRRAPDDPRLRGVILAGAPVHAFFTDREWQRALPRITVDTLGHLTGEKPADAVERMRGWAIDPSALRAIDVPVHALVSRRDEIIPPQDARMLRRHVRRLRTRTNDDVHGSPNHVAESGLWLVLSLLRMRRVDPRQQASLRWRLTAMRARGVLARGGG